MNIAYTPLKLLHHPDTIYKLRNGTQPSPILVQVVLSDLCNQDCSFCAYRLTGYSSNQLFPDENGNSNPVRQLPYGKVLEIFEDCTEIGVKAIEFTGGGEPTVHPQHYELFEKALYHGFDISLVTNGVLLNERSLQLLTRAKWVRFSIDAGSDRSYSIIRKVSKSAYNRVLKNIEQFVQLKKEFDSDTTIGISYVVLKENYTEIKFAVQAAKKLGVDYIRLGTFFSNEDEKYYDGKLEYIQNTIEDCKKEETPFFKIINQFDSRYSDLVNKNPDYKMCGHQYINTYIGADQNVYRCCALAYNTAGLIGSLKDRSFKELWQSSEKQSNFSNFDARSCERCPFNDKNKLINYIISKNPTHVNFV